MPLGDTAYRGEDFAVGNRQSGEMTSGLYDQITGIQHGEVEDRFGWCRVVEVADEAVA